MDHNKIDEKLDEYFESAAKIVVREQKATIGYLQRCLHIGFMRALNLMDQLEEYGIVGKEQIGSPREVLLADEEQLVDLLSKLGITE